MCYHILETLPGRTFYPCWTDEETESQRSHRRVREKPNFRSEAAQPQSTLFSFHLTTSQSKEAASRIWNISRPSPPPSPANSALSLKSIPSLYRCKELLANLSRVSCGSKFFPRLVESLRLQKSRCLANPSVTDVWCISLASGRNTAWSAPSPRKSRRPACDGAGISSSSGGTGAAGPPGHTPSCVDEALLWSEAWKWSQGPHSASMAPVSEGTQRLPFHKCLCFQSCLEAQNPPPELG